MRIYGKNSVFERLRGNPLSIRKIYLEHGFKGTLFIHKKARQAGIPVMPIQTSKMMKIGRDKNTQGVMADVEDFSYVPYEELIEAALKKKRCLIFLDGLNDPQNFGAMIRSFACLGKLSVVVPTHDSVGVTEAVLRVASGGENYVPISKVSNLANAIKRAQAEGFKIAGTLIKGGQALETTALPFPLGVVIGSEQGGVREVIRKILDLELTIPMSSDTLSFNAAQAATIIAYEVTRQKKNFLEKAR